MNTAFNLNEITKAAITEAGQLEYFNSKSQSAYSNAFIMVTETGYKTFTMQGFEISEKKETATLTEAKKNLIEATA